MKALTQITLVNGDAFRSPTPLSELVVVWAQMHKSGPGSVFGLDRITEQGKVKRVALLAGTILRVDEL